jgi:putative PIN family toxin of toxin-antitoxin system
MGDSVRSFPGRFSCPRKGRRAGGGAEPGGGFAGLICGGVCATNETMQARVVIDTNVLVGALLGHGGGDNREVLRACLHGAVKPVVGVALFCEYEALFLRSSLAAKSPLNEQERSGLLEAFFSVCDWVKVYYLWRPNLSDEADNHLIELALAGGADTIVTRNVRHVSRGDLRFPSLNVLSPSEFLQSL